MSLTGRAALIHALDEGGPALLAAAARLIGFEEKAAEKTPPEKIAKPPAGKTAFSPARESAARTTSEQADLPFWRVIRCTYTEAAKPGGGETEQRLAPVEWTNRPTSAPEFLPLSTWARLLPHLRRAAMGRTAGSQADIQRIVRRLGKGELLRELPRKTRPAWGGQIHIVLDRSDRLIPYWDDQEWIAGRLARVLPAGAYRLAFYCEGLSEPVFDPGGDYQIPAPGGLVLVLGDLGLLAKTPAVKRVWRDFGRRLRRGGCRAVTLFPCGTSRDIRYPPWQVLAWERHTAMCREDDKTALLRLLSFLAPAIRVEPGLLRAVRRWLGLDAGTESLYWQHADISGKSSDAATPSPARIDQYRQAFNALPQERRVALLGRLRAWRYALPDEVWFEECALNPDIYNLLNKQLEHDKSPAVQQLRQDIEEAENFFLYEGQQAAAFDAGARYWCRDMEKRIPVPARHGEKLRPVLNRFWYAVHKDDPKAAKPPGFDPAHIPSPSTLPLRTLQIYQQGNTLKLVPAPHAGVAAEQDHGSWLGQIQTRSGLISVDEEPPFWKGEAPAWAADWGRDEYGAWVEFVPTPPF